MGISSVYNIFFICQIACPDLAGELALPIIPIVPIAIVDRGSGHFLVCQSLFVVLVSRKYKKAYQKIYFDTLIDMFSSIIFFVVVLPVLVLELHLREQFVVVAVVQFLRNWELLFFDPFVF